MKLVLTILVLVTVLAAVNWLFEMAGNNLVTLLLGKGPQSRGYVEFVYYMFAVAGLGLLIVFFKDKLYA